MGIEIKTIPELNVAESVTLDPIMSGQTSRPSQPETPSLIF